VRVLVITSAYPATADDPRGVFIHRLARALRRAGVEVTVLAPGSPAAACTETRDEVHIRRATYWIPRWQGLATGLGGIVPNLLTRPWLAVQIPLLLGALTWRAVRLGSGYDVIHAHWVYPSGIAGLVTARWHRLPLVITSHGGDLNLARRVPPLRWLSGWVSRAADICIAVSEALIEDFRRLGVGNEKAAFVPLGVEAPSRGLAREDTAAFRAYRSHDGVRLVYVGSLIPRKSVGTLLEAYRELVRRGHSITLAVVGGGPEEPDLRSFVGKHSLRDVHFLGFQPPVVAQQWMAAADILVLPSFSEGRPVAIMEAMASRVPVVATDIAGTRELVENGSTGMLFAPGDAAALAECLERLIRDGEKRREMGRCARSKIEAEGLLLADVARKHVEIYQATMARHREGLGS
jgi:glycosyltransferase involved in cell wall biosynthesis